MFTADFFRDKRENKKGVVFLNKNFEL